MTTTTHFSDTEPKPGLRKAAGRFATPAERAKEAARRSARQPGQSNQSNTEQAVEEVVDHVLGSEDDGDSDTPALPADVLADGEGRLQLKKLIARPADGRRVKESDERKREKQRRLMEIRRIALQALAQAHPDDYETLYAQARVYVNDKRGELPA